MTNTVYLSADVSHMKSGREALVEVISRIVGVERIDLREDAFVFEIEFNTDYTTPEEIISTVGEEMGVRMERRNI